MALDVMLVQVAFWLSILVLQLEPAPVTVESILPLSLMLIPISTVVLLANNLPFRSRRYVSLPDVWIILRSAVVLALVAFAYVAARGLLHRYALSLCFGTLTVGTLAGVRVAVRSLNERHADKKNLNGGGIRRRRTLVIGAGDAGDLVIRDLLRAEGEIEIVGILDDAQWKEGLAIHGIPVLGAIERINEIARSHNIEQALIAIPSASGEQMRRIMSLCKQARLSVRTLPAVTSLVIGKDRFLSQLREIEIEDLLRRAPVESDLSASCQYLAGRVVLVTGAGGSIGSELCRQIVQVGPAKLILLGKGENSIFEIQQELLTRYDFQADCAITDIRDTEAVSRLIKKHEPDIVFHAAAHKHVPLMEVNPIEAVRNNSLASWALAKLCDELGVERFILISTDKAVNPTSVMGASKRLAELLILSVARKSRTVFSIVRFGNVLGSRGSLVPVLKKQIAAGGPVRITHPEMTRYFMTIPEASQLVLQAGAFGEMGSIYLLDMGDPVQITEIAEDLIRLCGLVPGRDIKVIFTGPRPGEKLHEELVHDGDKLFDTPHPKISRVQNGQEIDFDGLVLGAEELASICREGNSSDVRKKLLEIAHRPPSSSQAVVNLEVLIPKSEDLPKASPQS